ncbi:GCN5 family N-acetyltransferase [Mucor ambiguus]|uniref:GCN5 family N-acetyltransferase n=1 Tax=Mucor ambiguus TaxID=91626 RepID=A0A0C9M787_9FUNG|nr:GCN5 family N-acetyltransferase [Mucor ambiguus]
MVYVRPKSKHDYDQVGEIIAAAFKQQNETILVNKLRNTKSAKIPELSLVVTGDKVYVVMSCSLEAIGDHSSLVLASLAVNPIHQASSVGKLLIEEDIRKSTELGFRSANVLGHKDYCSKFGFEPASRYSITCPF